MTLLANSFDYAGLDKADRLVVEQKTTEIRDRMGRAAQNILEIGERLLVVKERLGHGSFGGWLRDEFDWSADTAQRMMNVSAKFKNRNLRDLNIAPSALYLLASPSTPAEVADQFIEQARNGEKVTHEAVRAAVAPPKTQADFDRQREELDAVDPLLAKHRDAQAAKESRRAEREEEEEDEPQTSWGGRTIPANAPDLNVEAIVRNDPAVRWTKLIARVQECIALMPAKDTLGELPKEKRQYIRERFRSFAKQFQEAV